MLKSFNWRPIRCKPLGENGTTGSAMPFQPDLDRLNCNGVRRSPAHRPRQRRRRWDRCWTTRDGGISDRPTSRVQLAAPTALPGSANRRRAPFLSMLRDTGKTDPKLGLPGDEELAEQTGCSEPRDCVSVAYRISLARGHRYGTLTNT